MNEAWRFGAFIGIAIILAFICQSIGLLIGAVFVDSIDAAVFVAPLSAIPALLFSGFFVRISTMPELLQPVSYMSYFRFAFESLLITTYGFNRCPSTPTPTWQRSYIHDHDSDPEGNSTSSIYVTDGSSSTTSHASSSANATTPAPSGEGSLLLGAVNPFMFDFPPPAVLSHAGGGAPLNQTNSTTTSSFDVFKSPQYNGYNRGSNSILAGESVVMGQFDLSDDKLHKNILILFSFVLILRLVAYFVLLYKSNRRK